MKRQTKFAAIILVVLLLSLYTEFDVFASKSFLVSDCCDDESYKVSIDDSVITVESDSYCGRFEAESNLYACCVYDGSFSFLGYTYLESNSYQSVILTINTASGTQKSYALNVQASDNSLNFASDKFGFCYFTDQFNSSKLYCCSKSGIEYTLEAGTAIRQLLCLDGESITAIAYDGVYTIYDGALYKSSDESIDVPCSYIGGGKVISQSNKEYFAKCGELVPVVYENTSEVEVAEYNIEIIVEDGFYIIPQGTTVAKLRKALSLERDKMQVSKPDGTVISAGKLGTGMTVSYDCNTRFIIIKGELTGEGNVNSRDLKLMMKHITGEEVLTQATQNAADINSDGVISTKDLLMLANMY